MTQFITGKLYRAKRAMTVYLGKEYRQCAEILPARDVVMYLDKRPCGVDNVADGGEVMDDYEFLWQDKVIIVCTSKLDGMGGRKDLTHWFKRVL